MFAVEDYTTGSGRDFVSDYLREVSKKYGNKDVSNIRIAIDLLEKHGFEANRYRRQLIKKIEGDLYELRPGNNRIFFFFFDGKRFVLLHGFRKKTQKTPQHEIETAKNQMDDYIRRNR